MPKKTSVFIAVAVVSLCLKTVSAQSKIGYVDSKKILSAFPAAIDAMKKLDAENTKWGQELQKINDDVKMLKQDLEQKSLLLSDAKKKEKQQELQNLATKAVQFQNEKWGEGGEFFKRQKELLQPVYAKINEAIRKIGDDEKYDLILDTVNGSLLYAQNKYDLTDQVLAELEKSVPAETSKTDG